MQEYTGMFTVLVFSVVGLQQTELPSYGTGEKTCLLNTVWSEDLGSDNPAGSLADDIDSDHGSLSSSSSSASPSTPEAAECDEIFIKGSDENNDNPISPKFEFVEPAGLQGKEPPINPLKKVIMTAVLDALKLMDESGSSIKTFSIL